MCLKINFAVQDELTIFNDFYDKEFNEIDMYSLQNVFHTSRPQLNALRVGLISLQ